MAAGGQQGQNTNQPRGGWTGRPHGAVTPMVVVVVELWTPRDRRAAAVDI
jgi:hypothetical protein